ncbi:MAG: hypothetical protein M3237_00315 [Actinomycetota bacterium]|nr:hypothetical protein [Actinomycetota bacterium]
MTPELLSGFSRPPVVVPSWRDASLLEAVGPCVACAVVRMPVPPNAAVVMKAALAIAALLLLICMWNLL